MVNKIRPFKKEHADQIVSFGMNHKLMEIDAGYADNRICNYSTPGNAFTMFMDEKPVFAIGIVVLWQGVAEGWVMANQNIFEVNAVVFEGPEDYHKRINDENLKIDENSILMIRGCGPVGYPGSAEVVNMQPPDKLLKKGINTLPTLGDGRQSGTSESPSILNVSPESAIGGALLLVNTGDKIKVDLNNSRIDLLISDEEIENRRKNVKIPKLKNQTPWQEIARSLVGQLETGACLETESVYLDITNTKGMPRHSH